MDPNSSNSPPSWDYAFQRQFPPGHPPRMQLQQGHPTQWPIPPGYPHQTEFTRVLSSQMHLPSWQLAQMQVLQRLPIQLNPHQGLPPQGRSMQQHSAHGYSPRGDALQEYSAQRHPQQEYPVPGYPPQEQIPDAQILQARSLRAQALEMQYRQRHNELVQFIRSQNLPGQIFPVRHWLDVLHNELVRQLGDKYLKLLDDFRAQQQRSEINPAMEDVKSEGPETPNSFESGNPPAC